MTDNKKNPYATTQKNHRFLNWFDEKLGAEVEKINKDETTPKTSKTQILFEATCKVKKWKAPKIK